MYYIVVAQDCPLSTLPLHCRRYNPTNDGTRSSMMVRLYRRRYGPLVNNQCSPTVSVYYMSCPYWVHRSNIHLLSVLFLVWFLWSCIVHYTAITSEKIPGNIALCHPYRGSTVPLYNSIGLIGSIDSIAYTHLLIALDSTVTWLNSII